MFVKPEEFAKSGFNFALFFANTAFDGIERLALLNLAAARSIFEASLSNISSLLGAKDVQSLGWASGAYIEGGLKQISAEDMEQVLASRVYGAQFSVADDAFVLSGSTRPEDLDVQLQVLTAYAAHRADPVFFVGQAAGLVVYFRNLMLIRKHRLKVSDEAPVE